MTHHYDKFIFRNKQNVYATPEDLQRSVSEHREQLHWLALFLTGDESLAAACLSHAALLAITQQQVFVDWIEHRVRRAVIVTAAKLQQTRILQLASDGRLHHCSHLHHPLLTGPELKLLQQLPHENAFRIDVLCRFALVMCGIEGYSAHKAALMLEVKRSAIDAAYCSGIESLSLLIANFPQAMGQPLRR